MRRWCAWTLVICMVVSLVVGAWARGGDMRVGALALCLPYGLATTTRLRALLARHQRAEPLPGLALETLHLQLLDRREIARAGLDLGAGQIDADLEVQVRDLLHHVFTRQIVAALPQHLFESL